MPPDEIALFGPSDEPQSSFPVEKCVVRCPVAIETGCH
jgi:hypothetical protein